MAQNNEAAFKPLKITKTTRSKAQHELHVQTRSKWDAGLQQTIYRRKTEAASAPVAGNWATLNGVPRTEKSPQHSGSPKTPFPSAKTADEAQQANRSAERTVPPRSTLSQNIEEESLTGITVFIAYYAQESLDRSAFNQSFISTSRACSPLRKKS